MLVSQKMFEFRVFTMKYWLILNPFTTVVWVKNKILRKFSSSITQEMSVPLLRVPLFVS